MKAMVLRKFRDKETGAIRKKGDVIEITEKRYDEILKVGQFVEKIEEPREEQDLELEAGVKPEDTVDVTEEAKEPQVKKEKADKPKKK